MKLTLVPWIREAHGISGDTVFREFNGETIVAARPGKRKTPFSPDQLAVQSRFALATDYADMVMLNPALLALYQQATEKTGKSSYILARLDWFDAPEVTLHDASFAGYKGQVGNLIKFTVRDRIPVEQVIVTLLDDETGAVIEEGQAVPEVAGTVFWQYTATKPVPAGVTVAIRIEAYDHPGNVGQAAGTKQIPQ